jgi:hypothetical protein
MFHLLQGIAKSTGGVGDSENGSDAKAKRLAFTPIAPQIVHLKHNLVKQSRASSDNQKAHPARVFDHKLTQPNGT